MSIAIEPPATEATAMFLRQLPERSLRAVITALVNHPAIQPLGTTVGDVVTPEAVQKILEQSPLLVTEQVHEGGSSLYQSVLAEAQKKADQRSISLFVLASVAFLKASQLILIEHPALTGEGLFHERDNRFTEFGHVLWCLPEICPDFDLFAEHADELTATTKFIALFERAERRQDAQAIRSLATKYKLSQNDRASADYLADLIQRG